MYHCNCSHLIDVLDYDADTLTIPGVDSENETGNGNVSFIEACRKKNTIPKLVIMEKPSAFTREVWFRDLFVVHYLPFSSQRKKRLTCLLEV